MANRFKLILRKILPSKVIESEIASALEYGPGPSVGELLTSSENLGATLQQLDTQFQQGQAIANEWSKKEAVIPPIQLISKEKSKMKKKLKEVSALEEHLRQKYGNDLANMGWHGSSSLQRMIWQDAEFISAMADPLFVKAVMYNAQTNKEANLGGVGGTAIKLSSVILSIGQNRISYMATVAPNWIQKPKIAGVDWSNLKNMAVPNQKDETPREATPAYFEKLHAALGNVQKVLNGMQTNNQIAISYEEVAIKERINDSSNAQLLAMIENVLQDEETAKKLSSGVAGTSTQAHLMANQCFEVVAQYPNVLKSHNGDHAKALGYGLVSHAMDAKHLIAAIYYLNKEQDGTKPGHVELKDFLEQLKSGLGGQGDDLMRARLQQIAQHIANNRNQIKLSDADLINYLEAPVNRSSPQAAVIALSERVSDNSNDGDGRRAKKVTFNLDKNIEYPHPNRRQQQQMAAQTVRQSKYEKTSLALFAAAAPSEEAKSGHKPKTTNSENSVQARIQLFENKISEDQNDKGRKPNSPKK